MDVTLRRDGQLPSDLAIATFGDHELLDFLRCPVLAVAQRHRDVAERVLEVYWQVWTNRVNQNRV